MLNLCKIFEKVSIFIYSNDINCCKEAIMKRYVIIDYLLRNNIIEQELYLKIYRYYQSLDENNRYECNLIEEEESTMWKVVL